MKHARKREPNPRPDEPRWRRARHQCGRISRRETRPLEEVILHLVSGREVSLYASAAILAEYEAVLSRPKFAAIGPDRIARLFAALKSEA